MQIAQNGQQLLALRARVDSSASSTPAWRPASGAPGSMVSNVSAANARHAQLLARNARQLARFHAGYPRHGWPWRHGVAHQGQVGNAITTARVAQPRRAHIQCAAYPLMQHVRRIVEMCAKPLIGDARSIPGRQAATRAAAASNGSWNGLPQHIGILVVPKVPARCAPGSTPHRFPQYAATRTLPS